MGAFYTTAAALPDLALLLLAVLIVVYFALRKEKAPGTGWLIALMVGHVGLHAVNFTAAGAYGGWAVHLNALVLAFPQLLRWGVPGFAHPLPRDPCPPEAWW